MRKWQSTKGAGNQTMNVAPESRNCPLMNLKTARDRRKGHQARNYKDEKELGGLLPETHHIQHRRNAMGDQGEIAPGHQSEQCN